QCGLLLLFFLFKRRLALSWRTYAVNLAWGLGIAAALTLSFSQLRIHFAAWTLFLDLADTAVPFVIAMYWLLCFSYPPQNNVPDSPGSPPFLRWSEALIKHSYGVHTPAARGAESFAPGIERTGRGLARKIAN